MPKRLYLRRFRRGEKQMLKAKLSDHKLPVWIAQRYRLVAAVRAGQSVLAAARRVGCAKETAYRWIAEFNESGFKAFELVCNPEGRPSQLTAQHLQLLIQIAQKRPTDVGLPFTNWSMTKLHDYLVDHRQFPPVGPEWLRRLLRRHRITWQRTKTWKQSNDPDFEAKKSAFWSCMPTGRVTGQWCVMTSWDRWNFGRWPECAGRITGSRNVTERPIRASMASSSCMGSTTCTPIASWAECASARPRRTSSPASLSCDAAIRRTSASTSSWTISRRTKLRPAPSFQSTTWRRCMFPPMPPGSTRSSVNLQLCMALHSRTPMIPITRFGAGVFTDTCDGAIAGMEAPAAIWRGLCVR